MSFATSTPRDMGRDECVEVVEVLGPLAEGAAEAWLAAARGAAGGGAQAHLSNVPLDVVRRGCGGAHRWCLAAAGDARVCYLWALDDLCDTLQAVQSQQESTVLPWFLALSLCRTSQKPPVRRLLLLLLPPVRPTSPLPLPYPASGGLRRHGALTAAAQAAVRAARAAVRLHRRHWPGVGGRAAGGAVGPRAGGPAHGHQRGQHRKEGAASGAAAGGAVRGLVAGESPWGTGSGVEAGIVPVCAWACGL